MMPYSLISASSPVSNLICGIISKIWELEKVTIAEMTLKVNQDN